MTACGFCVVAALSSQTSRRPWTRSSRIGKSRLMLSGIEDPDRRRARSGTSSGWNSTADATMLGGVGRRGRPARRWRATSRATRQANDGRRRRKPATRMRAAGDAPEKVGRQRRRGGRRLEQRRGGAERPKALAIVGTAEASPRGRSRSAAGATRPERGGVVAARRRAAGRCPADPGACANSSRAASSASMARRRASPRRQSRPRRITCTHGSCRPRRSRARRARRRSGPPPSSRATPGTRPPRAG